jgi:hypothetical protein
MKSFPAALLSALGPVLFMPAARAAITVTISPGAGGSTVFNVTQTAPNPILPTPLAVGGYIIGINFSGQSIIQDPSLLDPGDRLFSGSLGTVSETGGGGTAGTRGLSFYTDQNSGLIQPYIRLDSFFSLGPGNHQFLFVPAASAENAISFSTFVPGTYLSSDLIFGQVTTVVVPEAASMALGLAGALPLLLRRRRGRAC